MGNIVVIVDKILDYISYNWCQERPTHKLATDNLQIPHQDLSFLAEIFRMISKGFGLVIVPFQMLSDKKFSVHSYETATVFTTQNDLTQQNIATSCDKMLIYIASHRNNIIEATNKQIMKTITINQIDYDLPVNFWYSFNIDTAHKVYFYIHVSVINNYKGVVIAVDNKNAGNLTLMKDMMLSFYNQTIGNQQVEYNFNRRVDFI